MTRRPKIKPNYRIVSLEIKIHRRTIFVYVSRDRGDHLSSWKVYQRVTPSSLRRLASVAYRIVNHE